MKILVTGAAGFAGTNIAASLCERGYEVIGIMRRKPDKQYPFRELVHDLSQPFELGEPIDAIVHTAGAHPGSTVAQLKKDNIDTMQTLIGVACKYAIPKVIYLSAVSVYGEIHSTVIDENSDIMNPDAYGATKYLAEQLLLEQAGICGVCLRLPGIFGFGATKSWLVNTTRQICAGNNVTIYAPNFLSNNFVYIKDLARFIDILLSKKETVHSIYLLGSQQKIAISDLVFEIKKQAKSQSGIHIGKALKVPFSLDVRRAAGSGFRSTPPLKMIADYFERRNTLVAED